MINWNLTRVPHLFILVFALLIVACKKQGCTDEFAKNYDENAKKDDGSCQYKSYAMIPVTVNGTNFTQITGTIDESLTLAASEHYLLSGSVFVSNESTLSIEAGTTIYAADDGTIPFLAILPGSKINATGTATKPIVFTSIKASALGGDWGGIILNGYATSNTGSNTNLTGSYGGNLDNDNSGILHYVRVEYAGKQLSASETTKAFSFYSVGSGTSLSYLQAYRSGGDGFGVYGGTVDLTHALAYGSADDGFEFANGWRGDGSYWRVMQDELGGDSGIEANNNVSSHGALPYSDPELGQIELLGSDTSAHTIGLKLMAGTKAVITNLLISDFFTSLEIEHDVTLTNVVNGDIMITYTTASIFDTMRSYVGSKDVNGDFIDPVLVGQASASSNILIDGTATADGSWITGSWFRNL